MPNKLIKQRSKPISFFDLEKTKHRLLCFFTRHSTKWHVVRSKNINPLRYNEPYRCWEQTGAVRNSLWAILEQTGTNRNYL